MADTGKLASVEARAEIVRLLRRDLIGPLPVDLEPGDADLQEERLSEDPAAWYLSGFIAPRDDSARDAEEGEDPSTAEEAEIEGDGPDPDAERDDPPFGARGDDDPPPEAPAARRRFAPSSIGLTVILPEDVRSVDVRVSWGDYLADPTDGQELTQEEIRKGKSARRDRHIVWRRSPRSEVVRLDVPRSGRGDPVYVPNSGVAQFPEGWLELSTHVRPVSLEHPERGREDVQILSVFLVNARGAPRRAFADLAYAFQARIEVTCAEGLYPRCDATGWKSDDEDLRIADLHYRDEAEYAVGRNISASWAAPDPDGKVRRAWTDPLPSAEVERVAPTSIDGVEFKMEALASAAKAGAVELGAALEMFPRLYSDWIAKQDVLTRDLSERRRDIAGQLVSGMRIAQRRIESGIARLVSDDRARLAFELMNLAVARAQRQRVGAEQKIDPSVVNAPAWRPFQLAFILLNIDGLTDKEHWDRETVDLLFFPTGGGKTEAYLGLAAYAIAMRRLRGSGVLGAGVSVIMRYTLRLLTLDQLSRAAGVVCALELMRDTYIDAKGEKLLGDWPIEVGLWVGSDASPNRLGGQGDTGDDTAVTRVRKYKQNPKFGAPAPIKNCPWCATPFSPDSFTFHPHASTPTRLDIICQNVSCDFTRDRPLPLRVVDESIYRRLPAFVIATVDKFASLPWVGSSGAFFGHVGRADAVGFYGAAEPGRGRPLDNGHKLDAPDLIIQDELHLISGPLGTVAGLYETAIDRLASRTSGTTTIRPKIVASTATVRRAKAQIQALFDRQTTHIFPPPGVNRTDSWFAETLPPSKSPARLYVGLAALGRGPKLVFLRGLTTVLAAAQSLYERNAGGQGLNPVDPYMTALCYFNALRELGGARRIVEGEVGPRLSHYGTQRVRKSPADKVFVNRADCRVIELTSRESTDKVAAAKVRLETQIGVDGAVDVALATNMISVGLDIQRLGLMLVQGQPKTASEYIQATSRVGRDANRPGLVIAVLNLHKPRDRGHYENFRLFHRTFYRAVEATSVTPWSARSLDRSLAAVVIAIARHIRGDMAVEDAVKTIATDVNLGAQVKDAILSRAPQAMRADVEAGVDRLLAALTAVEGEIGSRLTYTMRSNGAEALLRVPLDRQLPNLTPEHQLFQAARSMRDVEPNVQLRIYGPDFAPLQADDIS